jgi:hypothetical protein
LLSSVIFQRLLYPVLIGLFLGGIGISFLNFSRVEGPVAPSDGGALLGINLDPGPPDVQMSLYEAGQGIHGNREHFVSMFRDVMLFYSPVCDRRREFDSFYPGDRVHFLFPREKFRETYASYILDHIMISSEFFFSSAESNVHELPPAGVYMGFGQGYGHIGQVMVHEFAHWESDRESVYGDWGLQGVSWLDCEKAPISSVLEEATASAAEGLCLRPREVKTQVNQWISRFCKTGYGQKICVQELCALLPVGTCSKFRHRTLSEAHPHCAGQEGRLKLPPWISRR